MRVNLSGATDISFDPVPAGQYLLTIVDHEIRESGENAKHPGAEYINWEFNIAQGDHEDRKIWSNTMLSHGECDCDDEEKFNKSLGSLVQLLLATGKYEKEDLEDEDLEIDFTELYGEQVGAVVRIRKSEEYGDSNEIKRFKSVESLPSGSGSASSSLLP